MARLLKVSIGAMAAMMLLTVMFPWQNPPAQVEAIFGLGAVGAVVSGLVLLGRRRRARRLARTDKDDLN